MHDPITQAAQAIIALINSRPQSSTVDEVVAIIAKAMPPPAAVPKLRAEWDALHAAMVSANANCSMLNALSGTTADVMEEAEDDAKEAERRLDECARRIAKEPVRTPTDLLLLAEVVHWFAQVVCWPDGIDSSEEQAALALVKGVRDLAAY